MFSENVKWGSQWSLWKGSGPSLEWQMKPLIQEEIPSNTPQLKAPESKLDPGLLASILSAVSAQTPYVSPYLPCPQGFPNLRLLASPWWLQWSCPLCKGMGPSNAPLTALPALHTPSPGKNSVKARYTHNEHTQPPSKMPQQHSSPSGSPDCGLQSRDRAAVLTVLTCFPTGQATHAPLRRKPKSTANSCHTRT